MEKRRKTILIVIIAILLFSSVIIFPLIFFFSNQNDILMQVIPSSLKSYPGHTAWMMAEIRSKSSSINIGDFFIMLKFKLIIHYKIS